MFLFQRYFSEYVQAIKDYFKSRPDIRKLLKYGKAFGIDEKIRTYTEVL